MNLKIRLDSLGPQWRETTKDAQLRDQSGLVDLARSRLELKLRVAVAFQATPLQVVLRGRDRIE